MTIFWEVEGFTRKIYKVTGSQDDDFLGGRGFHTKIYEVTGSQDDDFV